jgi:hypothetical protein
MKASPNKKNRVRYDNTMSRANEKYMSHREQGNQLMIDEKALTFAIVRIDGTLHDE